MRRTTFLAERIHLTHEAGRVVRSFHPRAVHVSLMTPLFPLEDFTGTDVRRAVWNSHHFSENPTNHKVRGDWYYTIGEILKSSPSRQYSETPQVLLPSRNESSRQWRAQALSSLSATISMATKLAYSLLKSKAKPLSSKILAQQEPSWRSRKDRRDTFSKESFHMMKGNGVRERAVENMPITTSKPFQITRLGTISMVTLCEICSVRDYIMSNRI